MAETSHLDHSGPAGDDGTQADTSPPDYNEATGVLDIEGLKTQTQVGSVFSALVHQRDQS